MEPYQLPTYSLKPYRCPICNGCGTVPSGFYDMYPLTYGCSSNPTEKCRACDGTGIIYGKLSYGFEPPEGEE